LRKSDKISKPKIQSFQILRGYPTLSQEGLEGALDFAARQFEEEEIRVIEDRP